MIGASTFQELTLDNGLKVFLIDDPTASLVSVRTYVKAGSVHEYEVMGSGASHYLEHIVAGGTTQIKQESQYKTLLSELGGAYNAYTTVDHTSYYINTTPQHLNTAVSILSEWMFSCSFNESEFKRERDVIVKEIEKNNASNSRFFYQLCQNNFYKSHPLRYPVIGYLENFKELTRKDLVDYYKTNYIPSNMILVIGGRFNTKELTQHIKDTFGKATRKAPPTPMMFNEPLPFSKRILEKEWKTSVTKVSFRFSTVDLYHQDLYALDLLEFILSNGEDSFLYKQLVDEKKLAYSVSAGSYTPSMTTGFFDISVEIDYKNLQKVQDELLAIIQRMKEGDISDERIQRAKKQKLADDILSISNIEDKVSRIGTAYLHGHTPYFFEDYVTNFKAIEKQDLQHVANTYLNADRMILTAMKPLEKATNSTKNTVAKLPSIKTPEKTTLKNGTRILFYKDKSLPKTYIQVMSKGGLRAETKDINGVGHLTTSLLGKASKKYSKEDILSALENNGASMGGSLGNNTVYYSMMTLSDDFESLLDIYIDTFLNAKFKKREITEQKRKTAQWITQRPDDWYGYSMYHFRKLFYKNHPYGLNQLGETDILETITPKQIETFYEGHLNPSEMVVSVFGDFDEKTVLKKLDSAFKKLTPFKKPFVDEELARELHKKATKQLINIPQDVSAVFVGFDSSSFIDKAENIRLDLVDSVLSGMNYPGGRLHNLLREDGLVYMVHATNQIGLEEGVFLIYALTSPDKKEKVLKIIKEQIKDIQTTLISDQEFKEALSQMDFYYKDKTSSYENLAIVTATDELYERGHTYFTTMDAQMKKLTKEDVKETALKFLQNPQVFIFEKK